MVWCSIEGCSKIFIVDTVYLQPLLWKLKDLRCFFRTLQTGYYTKPDIKIDIFTKSGTQIKLLRYR